MAPHAKHCISSPAARCPAHRPPALSLCHVGRAEAQRQHALGARCRCGKAVGAGVARLQLAPHLVRRLVVTRTLRAHAHAHAHAADNAVSRNVPGAAIADPGLGTRPPAKQAMCRWPGLWGWLLGLLYRSKGGSRAAPHPNAVVGERDVRGVQEVLQLGHRPAHDSVCETLCLLRPGPQACTTPRSSCFLSPPPACQPASCHQKCEGPEPRRTQRAPGGDLSPEPRGPPLHGDAGAGLRGGGFLRGLGARLGPHPQQAVRHGGGVGAHPGPPRVAGAGALGAGRDVRDAGACTVAVECPPAGEVVKWRTEPPPALHTSPRQRAPSKHVHAHWGAASHP